MRSSTTNTAAPVSLGLATAAEIGAALTATTALPELVATLHAHLKWLLPVDDITLCLMDAEGATYRALAHDGTEEMRLVGQGIVGWALQHATALDLPDLTDASALPSGCVPTIAPRSFGALLVLPLLADGRCFGALVLHSGHSGAYREIDRGLMHLIVLQVTAATRVALLLGELDGAEAIITGMARALEAKDPYTHGHSDRVTEYAVALAEAANLSFAMRDIIAHAGPIHDIGKIGVPDAVLRKPDRLSDEEFALIKLHPEIGDEICRPLRSLQRLRKGVRHHHESYDGRGYPDGLAGDDIPLEARVLAIADTFDAMTSTRPYRNGMPITRALAILSANEGPQWDPALIPLFCRLHTPRPIEDAAGIPR